ncbi:ribosome-recycling factor [Yamadazyma tenuis]|uniref:Ribosome-recycling factor, mitochondrial n=1 Tax=Candida tenuis (strain ATCC 10573 / BCRC 21748 / CBS 615 / JCM 9827 / NBRC 10315 / NRRL Y-1498 / VKM Y-70) TaxID=590646 RepID=G3B3N3_CANTC|nr:uncharacterized protein CANTEDRAFT_105378 [Yamadazyma tenuis ATCC 10573]EGV64192.1 hypothetical protein CANTEDRAFT_105378 [Yamadazyma tenuis ATCC 10573]WEJ96145.1 ribosome-recycling factor [Yamadazyma tenuis]
MFRSFPKYLANTITRPLVVRQQPIPSLRQLHVTPVAWAKAVKKSKKDSRKTKSESDEPSATAEELIDLDEARSKFDQIIDKFNKKANEVKLGKTNPSLFDNLDVSVEDHQTSKFNTVAQASIKGRNIVITVFNPDHVQNIINSILGSGLNMNPTFDKDTGVLKVPLPPITTETKQENAKVLKAVFEKFKNNNSSSLNAVRTDYKHKLKKLNKKSDTDMKIVKEFESLHKQYLDKLTDAFKSTEKVILK